MLKLAYNTTDTAAVDEQGYSVGGRSWGVIDTTDPQTTTELETGALVVVNEDAARQAAARGDVNPDVKAAVEALDARRARLEEVRAMDKDELLEVLPPEVTATLPVGASGEPAKADLVEAAAQIPEDELADPEPEPAKPAAKKTTSSRTAAKK